MNELRLRLRRPEEGWLPLALVTFMALVLAWAIDDPAWVNGRGALTDSLPLCAVLGVAFGVAGPKVGWNRWTTHLVGGLFAALLVPVLAGWADTPGSSVGEAFRITASGTVEAYLDIAWRDLPFTSQEIHYTLTLGIGTWATAQFAAYAVFGHRRPLNAVVVMALVLLGNMSLTLRNQLPHLVAFTAASLFLLIAMHSFDERATWLRRRIGDPSSVSGLYLRGGTVFIVVALVGSMFLTQRASSAPLAGAWADVDRQLVDIGETISRLFPVGGDLRGGGGVTFGDSVRVGNRWYTDDGVAFRATVPDVDVGTLYWRAATYDQFQINAWTQSDPRLFSVDAGGPLLVATPDEANPALTRELAVTVRPDTYRDSDMLTPGTPVSVDVASRLRLTGDEGWLAGVEVGGDEYTATARVLVEDTDVISGNLLRAASETYPPGLARYRDVPEVAMGPDAQDLLDRIRATARSEDPWDLATATVDYLRDSSNFTYDTNVSDVVCDAGVVECFARFPRGFCRHYASTMAILLRAANPDNPIPTRVVEGFLPGTPEARGIEVVRNDRAHMWVEVYFPGYGWIPFDPTGGGLPGQDDPPAPGPSVAAPTAPPATFGPEEPDPTRARDGADSEVPVAPGGQAGGPTDGTLLIVITLLLTLLVLAAAVAAWLRGPRGEVSPDVAWRSLSRGAARLGFAPRPTQTVYEYASSLGELVPVAQADLKTVADAKVETSYARVRLGGDRLRAVRDATVRLRFSLLRLLLRRGRGRRR